MKKISPDFKHEMCPERLDENFLNDFVGLYRHFFFQFEEMFNFKLKIQNLIRPTNVPCSSHSTTSLSILSSTCLTSAGITTNRHSFGTPRHRTRLIRARKSPRSSKRSVWGRRRQRCPRARRIKGLVSTMSSCRNWWGSGHSRMNQCWKRTPLKPTKYFR